MKSMAVSVEPTGFSPLLFPGEPEEAVKVAVELGYDAVELSVRDPTSGAFKSTKKALHASGLRVSAIATGQSYYADGLSPTDPSSSIRSVLADRMKQIIETAAAWNSYVVIGGIRGKLNGPESSWGEQLELARSEIRGYADVARGAGVTLLIEPINRYETNFINTVAEAIAFIDSLNCANVGVLEDTFHMNIEESSLDEAIALGGARLLYVHTADSNRLAPGLGHVDFVSLAKTLGRVGYCGYLCAEILPKPDSYTAASKAVDYLRSLEPAFVASTNPGGTR